MKLFKIMFLIACLGLVFSACDDFLETKSDSRFIENTVAGSVDNLRMEMYGGYEVLTQGDLWDYNLMWMMCDTDVECSFQNYDGARNDLCHYRANPGTTLLQATWTKLYNIIERANLVIGMAHDGPLWNDQTHSTEVRRLYGEAVALRAYCYYILIGLWGDVPFHATAAVPDGDLYLPKKNRDDIYIDLIDDLDNVQEYVPWSVDAATTRRITKGFIKGLRAKLALMYAGYSCRNQSENFITRPGEKRKEYYEIADKECKELMESGKHQLKPEWVSIFKDLHAYKMDVDYGEIMFEVAYGRAISGRMAQTCGMAFLTSPADPKYGRAAAEFSLPMHYYYTFDKKDQRRDISAELYNYGASAAPSVQRPISGGGTGSKPTKWRRSWITPAMGGGNKDVQATGVGLMLMRYTDIVLMYAETQNELHDGPTQAAKDALASVRRRAFAEELWPVKVDHYIDSISASKAKFFNALVDERAWEFSGEFLRKFDLIRWNLLGVKKDQMTAMTNAIIKTPDAAPYNWIPKEIYWKNLSDGETIEVLNPEYRLPLGGSIAGYTRTTWYANMSTSSQSSFYTSFDRVMNGYRSAMNNYLFPIPNNVIVASNGVLINEDQWRPYDLND